MNSKYEQLDLDFSAPAKDGYALWQWNRRDRIRRISETWGLPLHRRVRVRLRGIDHEIPGFLELAEVPAKLDRSMPLTLRLGRQVFRSLEIESCSVDTPVKTPTEQD